MELNEFLKEEWVAMLEFFLVHISCYPMTRGAEQRDVVAELIGYVKARPKDSRVPSAMTRLLGITNAQKVEDPSNNTNKMLSPTEPVPIETVAATENRAPVAAEKPRATSPDSVLRL